MAMNKTLDVKIKQLILKEGFDNENLYFAEYETFEEIPLFSRWKNINFLKNTPVDENNKLLISNAISLAEHADEVACNKLGLDYADYFCCVTLTKWDSIDEIKCITPNIYITRRRKWLFSHVTLKKSSTKEELITTRYVKDLGLENYEVCISGLLDGNVNRVYIVNDKFNCIIQDK